jgi:hypothetical protein
MMNGSSIWANMTVELPLRERIALLGKGPDVGVSGPSGQGSKAAKWEEYGERLS